MSATSRRALVRTGVATAWTAPIVLVAVPAAAATCSVVGVVQLTAQELGPRNEIVDLDSGRIVVETIIRVDKSGGAASLVSASVTGTNDDLLEVFGIGGANPGDIGTVTEMGGVLILTVTPTPSVPLAASQVFKINYRYLLESEFLHTINVSFQPDCGSPAICSITVSTDA